MRVLVWFAPLCFFSTAVAQRPIAPTRADLARAYLRFETALKEHPPADARIPELNRAFDALTLDFFAGDSGAAIQKLDALTTMVAPVPVATEAERYLSAIHVAVYPRSVSLVEPTNFTAVVRLVYPLAAPAEIDTLRIALTGPSPADNGSSETTGSKELRSTSIPKLIPGVATRIDLGRWTPEAGHPADGPVRLDWSLGIGCTKRIVDSSSSSSRESLAAVRDSVLAQLSPVRPEDPPLAQALAACRARARLLLDEESETNSAQFFANMDDLAVDVESEAQILLTGGDPYRRRAGDLWRTVTVGARDLTVRVFAPTKARGDDKLPLVIALHGAGGDENMFFDGYGAGRIKELAEAKGFVCVAPRVGFAGLSGDAFDAIVEVMLYDYAIDVKRVHVIGHSMGAAVAFGLASTRADRIASAACVCGGASGAMPKSCAPLLVLAGEFDPLAGATGLQKGADRLRTAGFDVEYRLARGWGHTLLVGAKLPETVDWLLAHTR